MGANNVSNPRIWLNANAYVAPVGTTAPTDIATAWNAAFVLLGLLSEDGLTESRDDDSNDHYAWGGILVRTTRSKHKRTFKLAVLEDNLTVFGIVNPGSTTATATGITTRTIKIPTPDPRAFGLELVDGITTSRLIIPRGEVVEVGERLFSDSEMASRELTIVAYPATDTTLYKEITNDVQASVA